MICGNSLCRAGRQSGIARATHVVACCLWMPECKGCCFGVCSRTAVLVGLELDLDLSSVCLCVYLCLSACYSRQSHVRCARWNRRVWPGAGSSLWIAVFTHLMRRDRRRERSFSRLLWGDEYAIMKQLAPPRPSTSPDARDRNSSSPSVCASDHRSPLLFPKREVVEHSGRHHMWRRPLHRNILTAEGAGLMCAYNK